MQGGAFRDAAGAGNQPGMTTPLLRRAGPADAETLSRIGQETFVETFGHLYPAEDLAAYLASAYDLEATRASLADPGQASWLVEATGGRAIRYATAGPCGLPHAEVGPGALELKRIYFRRAAQGAGAGSRLFDEVMAWMVGQSPADLWIGVWSENYGAQRFYARRGFVKVGEYGFPVGRTLDREFILRRRPAF
jgi:ribosomal protein S18 acetylase RimI-like enzyme